MRSSLLALNLLALAALVAPALLIFASAQPTFSAHPLRSLGYLAPMGLGALLLFDAMGRLGRDPQGAVVRVLFGALLFGAPLLLLLLG